MTQNKWIGWLLVFGLIACESGNYLIEEDDPPNATGNAFFEYPLETDAGKNPSHLILADWNTDNQTDLIIPTPRHQQGNSMKNDGTLRLYQKSSATASFPFTLTQTLVPQNSKWRQSVVVADFDRDQSNDLMISDVKNDQLTWLRGSTFIEDNRTVKVGDAPTFLTTADWNQDGWIDIAVIDSGDKKVSILLNKEGSFSRVAHFKVGKSPRYLLQGDWDRNAVPDLALLSASEKKIQIWQNDGRGQFQKWHEYSVGSSPQQMQAGDWDCDGLLDLAVNSRSDKKLQLFYGNGDGSFGNLTEISTGRGPTHLAAADFNEDGVMDFVISKNFVVSMISFSVLTGDLSLILSNGETTRGEEAYSSSPELFAATTHPQGDAPSSIQIGEFNGDQKLDLLLTLPHQEKMSFLAGKKFKGKMTCP